MCLAQFWALKGIQRRRQATEVLQEVWNAGFSPVRTLEPAWATVPRIWVGIRGVRSGGLSQPGKFEEGFGKRKRLWAGGEKGLTE